MPKTLIDLVIPVYNEERILADSVTRLYQAMDVASWVSWQIVVVDNGSIDETQQIGERLAKTLDRFRYMRLEQKGRGRALAATWTESQAEFSVYMDVDLSTDLAAIREVVDLLQDGADVVTGSRLDARSRVTRGLKREVLSRGYNFLIRMIMRTKCFDDAQCGFKGVRLSSVRPLLALIESQNWFFDTELLVLAEYASLDVRTTPIVWNDDSDSRVNIPMTIWEDLQGLARLRRTARRLTRQWKP